MDDIEEIFVILRGTSNIVEAETTDFVGISSAEELKQIPADQISDLLISARHDVYQVPDPLISARDDRGISVHLLRSSTRVVVSTKDDNQLMGAFYRLQQLITSRELLFGAWGAGGYPARSLGMVMNTLAAFALAVAFPVLIITTRDEPEPVGSGPFFVGVLVGIVGFLLWATFRTLRGTNPSPGATVVLKRKAEAPTFWERHRTAILINVTTNVVVALLFYLLGLIAD